MLLDWHWLAGSSKGNLLKDVFLDWFHCIRANGTPLSIRTPGHTFWEHWDQVWQKLAFLAIHLEQSSALQLYLPSLESFSIIWNILEYSLFFWNLFRTFWNFLESFRIFQNPLKSFGICWNLLESFGIFWNLLESFGFLGIASSCKLIRAHAQDVLGKCSNWNWMFFLSLGAP